MAQSGDILRKRIMGIDYGSKFSGTTVICYNIFHQIKFVESSKTSDADAFILNESAHLKPDLIFIDAPLSLPGVSWVGNGYNDYFYRKCDSEMHAMSPMFLGGLTARAMKLKKNLTESGYCLFETYPRRMLDILALPSELYKREMKDLNLLLDLTVDITDITLNKKTINTWHHLDALLAFLSAVRYVNGVSVVFGKADEGLVYV